MEKIYTYENGKIIVVLPNDLSNLKKATEDFMRNVIKGGFEHGNRRSSRDIRKK